MPRDPDAADGEAPALEILRADPPAGTRARATPLVFLHGAFTGAWCWAESFMPRFAAAGWRCRAPSLRGHGGSAGRARLHGFGIADYVDDLARAVDELEAPPVLIGHSMGGFVAMRYLETRPDLEVAGLALLAAVPPSGLAGPALSLAAFRPGLAAGIALVQSGADGQYAVDTLGDALFAPGTPPETAARYYPRMSNESLRATAELHGALRVDPARLRGRQPTLVLGGRHDRLIPPAFVRATGRALGVRAEILPDAGHAMMLGPQADVVAGRLEAWLAGAAAA